jgi:hypothetical protein
MEEGDARMDNLHSAASESSSQKNTGTVPFSLTADQAAALLGFLNDHMPDAYRSVARTDKASLQHFLARRYEKLRDIQEELKEVCHAREIHYLPPIGE